MYLRFICFIYNLIVLIIFFLIFCLLNVLIATIIIFFISHLPIPYYLYITVNAIYYTAKYLIFSDPCNFYFIVVFLDSSFSMFRQRASLTWILWH